MFNAAHKPESPARWDGPRPFVQRRTAGVFVPRPAQKLGAIVAHPIIWLTLLTALTAWMRFYKLDQPAIWGDEVRTFWRTCGTFQQLLDRLREDAFTPLHYMLTWCIAQKWTLTPFVLRFVPAVCSTLMVPAMYFLSRQLLSRRASFIVALFTCCSAWINNYGRDAKMYSQAWLFGVLCMACFFWWLRKGWVTCWLCWIAAGCAAVGFHLSAAMVIALCPLILLTSRKIHWVRAIMLVVGLGLIAAGPALYYRNFSRVEARVDQHGWGALGIWWVNDRNEGATGAELIQDMGAAFLYRYTYLSEKIQNRPSAEPSPVMLEWANVAMVFTGLAVAIGLLPWKVRDRANLSHDRPEHWWRVCLWLGAWIILLTYGAYCKSTFNAASPMDWIDSAKTMMAGCSAKCGWLLGGAWAVVLLLCIFRKKVGRWLVPLLIAQHLLYLVPAMLWTGGDHAWFVLGQWFSHLGAPWFLYPLLVFVPVLTFWYSGQRWTMRIARAIGLASIGAILFFLSIGIFNLLKQDRDGESIFLPRYLGFIWPAVAMTLGAALARLPGKLLQVTVVCAILSANLFQSYMRVTQSEMPVDRVVSDTLKFNTSTDSDTLVFAADSQEFGGQPGFGNISGIVGTYYFHVLSGTTMAPDDLFNRAKLTVKFKWQNWYLPSDIARRAKNGAIKKIVVWGKVPPQEKAGQDLVLAALGSTWKCVDEQRYSVYNHWTWGYRFDYRRREYIRIAATVTTSPSTNPSTRQQQKVQ